MHQLSVAAGALVCMLIPAFTPTLAEAQSQASNGTVLKGYIVDTAGQPVPYVYVFERASERFVVTDSDGWFVLALPVQRVAAVGARRIGYQPLEMQLDPRNDRGKLLRLVLMPATNPVQFTGRSAGYNESLDRSGYYRRMALAVDATFMTSDQIARRNFTTLSALLHDVAGVEVVSRGGERKGSVAMSRGGCTLGIVVNGQRAEGQMLPVSASGSMEIYPTASAVPNELQHHVRGCGLILVWR